MNAEISKIRRIRNNNDSFEHRPVRLSDARVNELAFQLNTNFSDLYSMVRSNNIDVDEFIKKFIANIYIVLTMFDEMGIYPDCFFDEIVKMNIEYQKVADDKSVRGDYGLFKNINLSARVSRAITNDFEKGYYEYKAYPQKDINENFLEILGFFQNFTIPYNINNPSHCSKVFNDLELNHFNIMDAFLNGDDIYDDIEYLSRLLFEYMSFFVSMGIYPKDYLDAYIEEQEKTKHR